MDEFNRNLTGRFVNRFAKASSGALAIESGDSNGELQKMAREIAYYKSKLQSCREKYESVETKIHDMMNRSHWKCLFMLDNVQSEEEEEEEEEEEGENNLHERLRNVHLSYDACRKKLDDQKNLNDTIRASISELTLQRNTLMEEFVQLRRNADDNGKKLARVNAMIIEQEEKNATLLRLQKQFGKITSMPQDIKKLIDAILQKEYLRINKNDNITGNAAQ